MPSIVIYSPKDSSRFQYVLKWLCERLNMPYTVTDVVPQPDSDTIFISYGVLLANAITVSDHGLLWQTGIQQQNIEPGNWNGLPVFYQSGDTAYSISFDLFSALFFLLSRYEEYYPYVPDMHGRYPAEVSVLFKNGWLERPLIDEWVIAFRNVIKGHAVTLPEMSAFRFLPTYDIDIAYSYRYKGFRRTIGGYASDILKGRFNAVKLRTLTLLHKKPDPYDSFKWLKWLHRTHHLQPAYFILCAKKVSSFDKNIPAEHPDMKRLIHALSHEGTIGIHPSYYSNQHPKMLLSEKNRLMKILRIPVTISRQHYIKNHIPHTYRLLLSKGIEADYSMGYATHYGFRAGTGMPFMWYNIKDEIETPLAVYPFCFMDVASLYIGLSKDAAFERLTAMTASLQKANSMLVTVFHNFTLGTAPEWQGWNNAYERFISRITS